MHFSIAAALLAVSAVNAVLIPADAPDGVYSLDLGHSASRRGGYTLIEEFNHTEHENAKREGGYTLIESFEDKDDAAKRDLPDAKVSCLGNTKLDGVNYEQAVQAFKRRSGDKVPGNKGIATKYGSTIVYSCSWRGDTSISSGEIDEAMGKIDSCGALVAGAVGMEPWGKNYGRDVISNQVCWGHDLA